MPQVLWESNRETLSAGGLGARTSRNARDTWPEAAVGRKPRGVHPFLRIVRQMSASYSTMAGCEPPERSF